MADTALFVGWGPVKSGKEKAAFDVFNEAVQFFSQCQQQGRIDSFEPYALEPHGGDLGGFFLLQGELGPLHKLRYSDDFLRMIDRASIVVDKVGVVTTFTGNRLQQLYGNYQQSTGDLS